MTNVSMNNHESKTFRDNALQTFWGYDDRRPRGISCTSRSERAELMREGWGVDGIGCGFLTDMA